MEIVLDTLSFRILFYTIIILYVVALVFLVINEIRNSNPKIKSFLWIAGAILIPILPFIYIVVAIVKQVKLRKTQC